MEGFGDLAVPDGLDIDRHGVATLNRLYQGAIAARACDSVSWFMAMFCLAFS
jgi:hypothetical protein